jgi:hypothetical protein
MYMYRDGTFGTGLQQMISGGLHVPEVNMNMMCMTACWLVGTHTLGLGKQQTLGFFTYSGRESIASHGDQERRVRTSRQRSTERATYVGYGDTGSSCKARREERQKILHDGEAAAAAATRQPDGPRARMQQLRNGSQGSSVYKGTYGRRRYAVSRKNQGGQDFNK